MKHILNFLALFLVYNVCSAQDRTQSGDIEARIESKRYEFIAESANPLRGRTIFLSTGHSLTVGPDSIEAYLPYYGRAYQAPMDPSDAGFKFTSTDFEYSSKPRKKRGWEVYIKTNDVSSSPRLNLTIAPDGRASLRITSIDRQSISFDGYIRKPQ
jgi:hypothetical protein